LLPIKKRSISMPIYEYQCKSCNTTFEKLVFKGDDESITCPNCDAENVKKLLSAASFMGGSGFGACSPSAPSGFS
jgi:putative FmdB family regulatory protein